MPVEHVADTAFLTAMARALESDRADAHFHDPHARALAGQRGRQLLEFLSGGEWTAASCVIRTQILDELLLRTLAENQVDVVVNLGAGLDARPYRLPLEASLRWIEVDSRTVLDYKESKLRGYRPFCRCESIPLDITDADATQVLLREIAASARQSLVITEGVLAYLTAEQVHALALGLSLYAGFRWWLTDLISPAAIRLMSETLGDSPVDNRVALQFAPQEGSQFFCRYGWETKESRSCLDEGYRLDRWFLARALLSASLTSEQRSVLQRLFMVVRLGRPTH